MIKLLKSVTNSHSKLFRELILLKSFAKVCPPAPRSTNETGPNTIGVAHELGTSVLSFGLVHQVKEDIVETVA